MIRLLAVLTVALVVCGGVFAGEIVLSDARGNGVEIISEATGVRGGMRLRMTCSIDKLYYDSVETERGEFTLLYTPQFYFGGEYGGPQLPVINRLVQVPFGAELQVNVRGYDAEVINLSDHGIRNRIFPRQPSAPKDGTELPFVYERSAYMFRGFRGVQITDIEEAGTMRHMRLAHLTISPIEYDPVENKIQVFNNIELELILNNADMTRSRQMHDIYWSPAFAWLDTMVTVPDALRFERKGVRQSYVIASDPMFVDAIAPFAEWKQQKGFVVDLVDTGQFGTGNAVRDGLQSYIHELYNNPTPDMPAPSYVLFVGDHDKIPAFQGQTGSHITDLYYATVTPGSYLPDILTGRFSAQNLEQLMPQIEKTLEYERFEFPDPSFLDDVVLIAGYDWYWAKSHGWSHINYIIENYINQTAGFRDVNTYYSSSSQQNVQDIINDVSRGVSFVNYTAHGSPTTWADPRFTISDINNLGNKGKYPYVIGNCCITNKFELATCFGEAWLRAEDAGAIGYVGGSNNTYWHEDLWWGVGLHSILQPNNQGIAPSKEDTGPGAFEAMFEGDGICNAGFMMAGNLAVEESTTHRKRYYWEVYHLMGDPALRTYMGQPNRAEVEYQYEIDARATSMKIHAIPGSYAGITFEGQLLGAGYVGQEGYADISLSSLPEFGEATVVVTASGTIPHMGTVSIGR